MTDLKHYRNLGVDQDATPEEIKSAYRAQCKEHHPDRNDNSPESVSKTQDINAAYEILSDEKKREYYNVNGDMSSEERSLQEAVSAMILQAFIEGAVNPIAHVRMEQQRQISEWEHRIRNCLVTVRKMTRARKRMKKHPASWTVVMNSARRDIHNNWRKSKQAIEYSKTILELLKQYELEKEETPQMNSHSILEAFRSKGGFGYHTL